MNLSRRLTLDEATRSQTAARRGIDNTPNLQQIANLRRAANELYEPACDILGYEPVVSSGFRSLALNSALKGSSTTSLHMEGLALDLDPPPHVSVREAFDKLRASDIAYEEIILECNSWVHIAIARVGAKPKREQLIMWLDGKTWRRSLAPPIASAQADGVAA